MSRMIALTGATGFIGSAVLKKLAIAGWQIRALARPTSNRTHLAETAVEWIEGDLADMDRLRHLVSGARAVVHCAGAVRGVSRADFNRVNVDGVRQLVQTVKKQNDRPYFLLISSLAAREPHLSPYAASKRQGEEMLAATAADMPWTVLRPPAVYGPGERELLPLFRWMARGVAPVLVSENTRFSLLYIDDLAEAVVNWADSGIQNRQVFELHDGHPNGYSWSDLIAAMTRLRGRRVIRLPVPSAALKLVAGLNLVAARLMGNAPILTPGKVRELRHPNWVCDNDIIRRSTGWMPRILLPEGLRRTLQYLDESNKT